MKKVLVGLLAAALALTGCGGATVETDGQQGFPGAQGKGPVKIGIILAGTGPFAELGADVRRGLELYLEQNGNQLAGRPVEVYYEDGKADPQASLRAFRQLVLTHDPDFVVAGDSSAVMYALKDEIEKDPRIMLVPIALGMGLSWDKSDYVFRLIGSVWQGATIAAEYVAKHVGKRAIIIASDYPGGDEGLQAFSYAYQASGGQVVATFRPPLGATDYAPYINQMAQNDADVVYSFLIGSDAVRFLTQFAEMGMRDRFALISPFAFSEVPVIDAAGEAALNTLTSTPYSPWLDNAKNQEFVKAYTEKFNRLPTIESVAGYDIGQVIAKALELTGGDTDPDKLKDAIKGMSIDSPRGPVSIDPDTHELVQNFYIARNVRGKDRIVLEVLETYEQVKVPAEPPAGLRQR